MALFRARIRLHSLDGTPDSTIDHRAVKYLARLVVKQLSLCSNCSVRPSSDEPTKNEQSLVTRLAMLKSEPIVLGMIGPMRSPTSSAQSTASFSSRVLLLTSNKEAVSPLTLTDCE